MSATVGSLIDTIEPEYQEVIRNMLMRRNTSLELLIKDVPRMLQPANMEERLAIACIQNADKVKFAPKLDFTKRCEILALHRMGFPNEILAKCYGIDRRTVTHIFNSTSPHYKQVREAEIGMGRSQFVTHYITKDVLDRAESFRGGNIAGPNRKANKKQGLHHVTNNYTSYAHRVVIQWLEADEAYGKAGWYYRDMDGDSPDKWFIAGADEKNTMSSMACYSAMLDEIMDAQRVLDRPPAV